MTIEIGINMANDNDKKTNIQEQKLVNEANIEFKVQSIRNKMLAEWAGKIIGYDQAKIIVYMADINKADFKEPGDADVIDKIYTDLKNTGHEISRKEIKNKIIEFSKSARQQIIGKS